MQDFNLESSVEFQKIRDIRKIISGTAGGVQGFASPIHAAVSFIVNRPDKEVEIVSDLSARAVESSPAGRETVDRELALFAKKKDLIAILTRPELVNSAITDFNSKLSKNIYSLFAISNYAFADHIFRYECETEELKKFRGGTSEDPQSIPIRTIRRKAEESYKNNRVDEAIKFFGDANAKYNADFTIYYQLGLIYFFEKADFRNALENFRLASKYAYNKYTPVFVHSMAFIGLMLRLYAAQAKNHDMLNEAYQAIYQAYTADTGYNFSKYALAQCSAAMAFRSDLVVQANSLIKNLVSSEKLFGLQILYDTAFNSYIDELEKLIKNIYNEVANNIARLFEKIDLAFDLLSHNMHHLTVPARVAAIKGEYRKICDHINSNRTFFDLDTAYGASTKISGELEELAKEVERNRKYSETKALVESAVKNYREEFEELTRNYAQTELKFNDLKQQYFKLDSYYPAPEFDELIASLVPSEESPVSADKKHWRDSGLFVLIKIISGGFTFIFLFVTIIILSVLFSKGAGSFFSVVSILVALIFMPMYATVFAEIFFNMIEIKRRNLLTEMKKLRAEIDINKIKVSEIDKKTSAKYIEYISEQGHLTPFVSEKMFEACLDGNVEQIKAMIPSLADYKNI